MMRVRTYDVLSRAVSEGVAAGWRRAHKHTAGGLFKPNEQAIRDEIEEAVLLAISEVFAFDERSVPAKESDLRWLERSPQSVARATDSTGGEGHDLPSLVAPSPPRSSKRRPRGSSS